MRLRFSILWFDDRQDYLDSLDFEPLNKVILSWGFSPDIRKVSTAEDFATHRPYKLFDLIVIDRNLEGYEDGQKFISDLRNHSVYTEVIFYTIDPSSNLWDDIHANKLEGVFISSRTDIFTKIERVGYQSIRKVLDLENMRGIVMAEVGELDQLLETIIYTGIKELTPEQQISIFNKFHKGATDQIKQNGKLITEFISNPEINKMLDLCDSYKRWTNFLHLRKLHEKLKGKANIGDFNEEILKPRNFLAHGKPVLQSDGVYLFLYNQKEFLFDEEASNNLRKTIIKYKEGFSEIIRSMENK